MLIAAKWYLIVQLSMKPKKNVWKPQLDVLCFSLRKGHILAISPSLLLYVQFVLQFHELSGRFHFIRHFLSLWEESLALLKCQVFWRSSYCVLLIGAAAIKSNLLLLTLYFRNNHLLHSLYHSKPYFNGKQKDRKLLKLHQFLHLNMTHQTVSYQI